MTIAIARPYATAVFHYAQEQDVVAVWRENLARMAQAAGSIRQFTESGVLITDSQAAEIVLETLQTTDKAVQAVAERFLALLVENGRVSVLPEIAAHFDALCMEAAGELSVRVEFAMPISDETMFNEFLQKHLGKKVQVTYEENSALLGGVRVYVNDDVIDASIRGRLNKLAGNLATQGSASLSRQKSS